MGRVVGWAVAGVLAAAVAAAPATGAATGFVDLFNGKDLAGWVNVNTASC